MDASGRDNHIRPKRLTVIFLATILLVAALGAVLAYRYYDNGVTGTTRTSSSVSSLNQVLSASDYNSSLGLVLTLSISNGTIPQDDGISLHVALNNTLATQNSLLPPQNGSSLWTPNSNVPSWDLQVCTWYPIGVEIFQGNYASGNLSQAEPLDLIAPNAPFANCADHVRTEVSFAPLSGNITSPVAWWVNQSAAGQEYWGSWGQGTFHSFEPGTYTAVGEDWWGQVAILHFQAIPDQIPLDCATIVSNPSFVGYTNGSASAGPLKLEAYYQDTRVNDTVVLALSNKGNATLAVSGFDTTSFHFGSTPYSFSPNGSRIQSWQYFAPNGTLGYPAVFPPNDCSLISMTLSSPFPQVPLTLTFTNNETQTFTFKP